MSGDGDSSSRSTAMFGAAGLVMMGLRVVLIALLVAATAAFVVGVSIERSQGENHAEPATAVEGAAGKAGEPGEAGHEEGAESGEQTRPAESAGAHADEDRAEKFLGVDYEAVPFIVLAAALSLAAAVWLLPGSVPLLARGPATSTRSLA